MGLDVKVGPLRIEDERDLDEFVVAERGELNRTWGEAVDLAELLTVDKHTRTWVARERRDNEIVGFAALHRGRKKSDEHTAALRLHVGIGWRREGVGSELIGHALAYADGAGITRVTATPYVKRRTWPVIFSRNGFILEGIMVGAVQAYGELYDMALLARVTATGRK